METSSSANPIQRMMNSKTFLGGMETCPPDIIEILLKRSKTFLGGMETNHCSSGAGHTRRSKTFLGGMETAQGLPHRVRNSRLKNLPWRNGNKACSRAPPRPQATQKPSLEEWKPVSGRVSCTCSLLKNLPWRNGNELEKLRAEVESILKNLPWRNGNNLYSRGIRILVLLKNLPWRNGNMGV